MNINLLPDKYKKELNLDKTRRFLVFIFASLSFVFFIFSVLFLFSFMFIKVEKDALSENINTLRFLDKSDRFLNTKKELLLLNKKINLIEKDKKENIFWSDIIKEISDYKTDGIYFKRLSFSRDKYLVVLSGFSENRESVLDLQNKLKNNKHIDTKTIKSPKSNILKDKNVSFSFTFNLLK